MKKRIALVGGSGFVGSELFRVMSSEADIINYDKRSSLVEGMQTAVVDVRDKEALIRQFQPADWLILLAAEHHDNVSPVSLYYDVNVTGAANVLAAMNHNCISKILFVSSVSIYGLNQKDPGENTSPQPFNDYGKSKWQAEEVMRRWHAEDPGNRTLVIVRPTVIFGPGNKGNVYQLLKQIESGKFIMVGNGRNKKSMAYIENVALFMSLLINEGSGGYQVYNYADKPDLTMNELITCTEESMHKKKFPFRIPYFIGYAGGLALDILSKLTGKKFPISAVRIKKWCAETQYNAEKKNVTGFQPPYSLQEGLQKTILALLADKTK